MLRDLIKILFFFIIKSIPKKKRLLIFGDRAGLRFADNSRHLFLYLNKFKNDYRCIWITKDEKIVKFLRHNNFEVYKKNSLKGIYFCLVAEWHLFNFVEEDINSKITIYSKCILLWHGVLPKKVNEIKHSENFVNNFIFKRTEKYFVYPNKELAQPFLNRFPKYKYNLLESNLPRNLIFEKGLNNFYIDAEKSLIKKIEDSKKKIFGYFPTWREDGLEIFRDVKNNDELEELNLTLKKNNSLLLLKKHMNSEKKDGDRRYNPVIEKMINFLKEKDSIIFADYETDLNSILYKCDYLITDYSGVVFDYLFLNRPIIFYVPDYYEFEKNTGLEINVIKKNIGKIANNVGELSKLIKEVSHIKNEEPDRLKNKENLKNMIFPKNNNGIDNIFKILERI